MPALDDVTFEEVFGKGVQRLIVTITTATMQLADKFTGLSTPAPQALAAPAPAPAPTASRVQPTGGGPDITGVVSGFAALFGPVGEVVGAVVQGLEEMIGKTKEFVAALAPGTIFAFDTAIRDLKATIGVAFEPIFTTLADTFRQVGGIILPVMRELRPIIQQISQAIGGTLVTVVESLASSLKALAPILDIVARVLAVVTDIIRPFLAINQVVLTLIGAIFRLVEGLLTVTGILPLFQIVGKVFEGLGQAIEVVSTTFQSLFDSLFKWVAGLLGFDLADTLQAITIATHKVIEAFLVFTATLLRFFGFDKALANLIKALEPKTGVVAAATNPRIEGFEAVAKDFALAAAAAAGSGGAGAARVELTDILEQLRNIQSGESEGNANLVSVLNRIAEYLQALAHPGDALLSYADKKIQDVKGGIETAWNHPAEAFDYAAEHALGLLTGGLFGD